MEQGEYGGSEQPDSSDIGQSPALRMIGNGTIEQMVLDNFRQEMKQLIRNAVQREIEPAVEVAVRKVVQAELQKFEEKLSTGWTRNDSPNERRLKLKFLGEVPRIVHTGEELIDLKVALFDASEHIVTNGCESSARVEIVLLDASSKDDGNSITPQNFDGRIISAGDKTKPHFAKNVYIHLDKGVGTLSGLKLGHGEDWTKSYNCRLGAMIARKFAAQEAWTVTFKVKDKRLRHNEKHDTPSPSSKVCRLKGIGRDGKPFSRLTENNIKTVLDFLFWLSVNPNGLQKEILRTGDCKWNIIVAHARECKIDDKKVYAHKSLTEPQTHVFYDAVGELKGLIEDETNYIPMNNLVADKKERARELLASVLEPSAFAQRYNTSFEDEAALLQQFPIRSSAIDAPSNPSIQQLPNGNDLLTSSANILDYQPHLPFPNTISADIWDYGLSHSLESTELEMGPALFPDPLMFGGGPETVGGSRSNIHFNVELYSNDCPFNEEFCLSQVDSPMNERNADEGRKKWNLFFCVLKFRKRVASDVHSPIRKKQRVGGA